MAKKICYVPWLGTEKNNKIFKNDIGSWEYILKQKLEKQGIEIYTDDLIKIEDSDGCIFFDNLFYKNLTNIEKLYKSHLLEKSVYIDYEPPTGHCKNHDKKGMKALSNIFNKIITFNDDIVDNKKFIKGNIANYYSKELQYKGNFKSRKLLTMITNNTTTEQICGILNFCNQTDYYNIRTVKSHPKSLYNERMNIAEFFFKKCPEEFDIYGFNWPDKFTPILKGYLDKKEKLYTLSQYKFAISYDSYKNQNGYISEKIFDCFNAKTVPIYWGANNVTDYIPNDCFIDKRRFKTYQELFEFIKNMTEKQYNKYIKNIEKFLKSDKYTKLFSSEASAEIISKALLDVSNPIDYEKAKKSIEYFKKKQKKVKNREKICFYISETKNYNEITKLAFTINDFYQRKNINYIPYINGKKVKKMDYQINFLQDNNEYKFKINLENYKTKKNKIKVKIVENNSSKWLVLDDLKVKYNKDYFLIKKHDFKTLYFYSNFNKSEKLLYFIIHNKKMLLRKIKTKINIIIKTIKVVRHIYWQDIKDVFK